MMFRLKKENANINGQGAVDAVQYARLCVFE